LFKKNTVL